MKKINKKLFIVSFSSICVLFLLIAAFSCIASFDKTPSVSQVTPDVEEIRSLCSFATTELDYNNVAKSTKSYWFFKKWEKKLWIEHKGVVTGFFYYE